MDFNLKNHTAAWGWQAHNSEIEAFSLANRNLGLQSEADGTAALNGEQPNPPLGKSTSNIDLARIPVTIPPFSFQPPSLPETIPLLDTQQFGVPSPSLDQQIQVPSQTNTENMSMQLPMRPPSSIWLQSHPGLVNMRMNNIPDLESLRQGKRQIENTAPAAVVGAADSPVTMISNPAMLHTGHRPSAIQQARLAQSQSPITGNKSQNSNNFAFGKPNNALPKSAPSPINTTPMELDNRSTPSIVSPLANSMQSLEVNPMPPPPRPLKGASVANRAQIGSYPVPSMPGKTKFCSLGFGSQASSQLPNLPKEMLVLGPTPINNERVDASPSKRQKMSTKVKDFQAPSSQVGRSRSDVLNASDSLTARKPEFESRGMRPEEVKDFLSSLVYTGKPSSDVTDRMPEVLKSFNRVPEFKGNPDRIIDLKLHMNELTAWSNGFTKAAIRGYERIENMNLDLKNKLDDMQAQMRNLFNAAQSLRPPNVTEHLSPLDLLRAYVLENQDLSTELEKLTYEHSSCPPVTGNDNRGPKSVYEKTLQEQFDSILERKNQEIAIHQDNIAEKNEELTKIQKTLDVSKNMVSKYQLHIQDLVNRCRVFETFKKNAGQEHIENKEKMKDLEEIYKQLDLKYKATNLENINLKNKCQRLESLQGQYAQAEQALKNLRNSYNSVLQEKDMLQKKVSESTQIDVARKNLEENYMQLNSAYVNAITEKMGLEEQLARQSEQQAESTQLQRELDNLKERFAEVSAASSGLEQANKEKENIIQNLKEKQSSSEGAATDEWELRAGELIEECQLLLAQRDELERQCQGHLEWHQQLGRQVQDLSDAHLNSLLQCESMKVRLDLAGLPPKVYRKKINTKNKGDIQDGREQGAEVIEEVEREEVCMTIDEIRGLMELDRFKEPFIQKLMREGDERWRVLSKVLQVPQTDSSPGKPADQILIEESSQM